MQSLELRLAAMMGFLMLSAGVAVGCHKTWHKCPSNKDLELGVSWDTLQDTDSRSIDAQLKAMVDKVGGVYRSADAIGDVQNQNAQIEALIGQDVDVLLVRTPETKAASIVPVLEKAKEAGIHVISMGAFIKSDAVVSIVFDSKLAGKLEAERMLESKPDGKFLLFEPPEQALQAKQMYDGMMEVLEPKISNGKIEVVGKIKSEDWKGSLPSGSDQADAFVTMNNAIAAKLADAAKEESSDHDIAISGQNPDAQTFKRIAAGTQLFTVWEDPSEMAASALDTAVDLVSGEKQTPDKVVLKPTVISNDNLSLAVEAGILSKGELCVGGIQLGACK